MNNSRFFIGLVLVIAILASVSEVLISFFGLKPKEADILPPDQLLPATLNEQVVISIIERGDKYLVLKLSEFESGEEVK